MSHDTSDILKVIVLKIKVTITNNCSDIGIVIDGLPYSYSI